MDQVHARIELLAQAVQQEIVFATRQAAGMRHQSGRFVDHRAHVIAVQHRQGGFAHRRRGQAAANASTATAMLA